jgi:hypothetical protein
MMFNNTPCGEWAMASWETPIFPQNAASLKLLPHNIVFEILSLRMCFEYVNDQKSTRRGLCRVNGGGKKASSEHQQRGYRPHGTIVRDAGAEQRRAACDCEFAALAQPLSVPLVTSDKKLLRAFPGPAVSMDDFGA